MPTNRQPAPDVAVIGAPMHASKSALDTIKETIVSEPKPTTKRGSKSPELREIAA